LAAVIQEAYVKGREAGSHCLQGGNNRCRRELRTFPKAHRAQIHSTDLLERLNAEVS
jgi:hypothetical protein